MASVPAVLELRVDVPEGSSPDRPVVTILVDGVDVIGRLTGGFIGFDPADLLDSGALVPTEPARRVALYRCGCGEPGCGSAAARIEESGDQVRWSDFRDFVGVYPTPLAHQVEAENGKALAVPDLMFDAAQYRREVARAMADRGWETAARVIARLLLERLREDVGQLADQGYWVGWVTPHGERPGHYAVEFIGPTGQLVVVLEPAAGAPGEQAEEMAGFLFSVPPDHWPTEFVSTWAPADRRDAVDVRRRARAAGTRPVAEDG